MPGKADFLNVSGRSEMISMEYNSLECHMNKSIFIFHGSRDAHSTDSYLCIKRSFQTLHFIWRDDDTGTCSWGHGAVVKVIVISYYANIINPPRSLASKISNKPIIMPRSKTGLIQCRAEG